MPWQWLGSLTPLTAALVIEAWRDSASPPCTATKASATRQCLTAETFARSRPTRKCVYSVCMSRVNVYLPDDLAAQAKDAGVNLSAVTQAAVRQVLAARSTDAWLAALPRRQGSVAHESAMEALDAVRDEAPTRHG